MIDWSEASIRKGDYRTKILIQLVIFVSPGAIGPKFEGDETDKTFRQLQSPS